MMTELISFQMYIYVLICLGVMSAICFVLCTFKPRCAILDPEDSTTKSEPKTRALKQQKTTTAHKRAVAEYCEVVPMNRTVDVSPQELQYVQVDFEGSKDTKEDNGQQQQLLQQNQPQQLHLQQQQQENQGLETYSNVSELMIQPNQLRNKSEFDRLLRQYNQEEPENLYQQPASHKQFIFHETHQLYQQPNFSKQPKNQNIQRLHTLKSSTKPVLPLKLHKTPPNNLSNINAKITLDKCVMSR